MKFPFTSLLLIFLQERGICAIPCENKTLIFGAEEGSVLLQVNPSFPIRDISWFVGEKMIASTYLKGAMHVPDNDTFANRLSSTGDGSLRIHSLRKQDRGLYTAYIRHMDKDICTQEYELRVGGNLSHTDIHINHSVTIKEFCDVALSCAVYGTDVTLNWRNVEMDQTVSVNGDLHVYDAHQGETYICTAGNPVKSVSKGVTPWDLCEQAKALNHCRLQNILKLALLIGITLQTICLLIHQRAVQHKLQRGRSHDHTHSGPSWVKTP